jgi:RNA polymerase sigma-70 factor (ECF subfamily)
VFRGTKSSMDAVQPFVAKARGIRGRKDRLIMENNLLSDAEAIRLAQEGCSHAFECLYKSNCRRVYRLCLRMARNFTEAEDLTQDVFFQLFRKIHTFRGESSFSTWLYRLTVNVSLMRLRKKRYFDVSLDTATEPGEEFAKPLIELCVPDIRLIGVLDHIHLSRAIDQLPKGCKEIFILHDVEGYEHNEIAKILECSVGNCKSQLFKARQRLRKLLQEVLRSGALEKRASARSLRVQTAEL